MHTVTLPVHPLTRRVLLAEYGQEPISPESSDILFDMLSGYAKRSVGKVGSREQYTHRITFLVRDDLARHIAANAIAIAARLLRWHRRELVMYAEYVVRARGLGNAKPAIESWLSAHDVSEDEYAADTAYKMWQRFNWKVKGKNPVFFGQKARTSALNLSQKRRNRAKATRHLSPTTWSLRQAEVEMAAARFTSSLAEIITRPHKRLLQHARCYYYIKVAGYDVRTASRLAGLPRSTAHYGCQAMQRYARANPAIGRLLRESLPTIPA